MVTRRHVAVIGAGLAGAACARALSKAGLRVTVFEAQAQPATGASGNPIGILHPLVSKDHNLASQWVALGMSVTLKWLAELGPIAQRLDLGPLGASCGVAQLNDDCSELMSWAPEGAWIRPQGFVMACLEDARAHQAEIFFNHRVAEISPDGSLRFADGSTADFDAVVVCAAGEMDLLLSQHQLMLNAIRGTVTSYSVPKERSLPCVICGPGYATPVIEGQMVVGASYERLSNESNAQSHGPDSSDPDSLFSSSVDENPSATLSNLDRLRVIDERLAAYCEEVPLTDRTSIRSATLDRMPHVGRVLDVQARLTPRMSQLAHMPRASRIWVLGGLGSRGLSSAPLGAELIAAQMLGLDLSAHSLAPGMKSSQVPVAVAVSQRILNAVDPVRFALRAHQRRGSSVPC